MRIQQDLLAIVVVPAVLSTCVVACGSSDGQGSLLGNSGLVGVAGQPPVATVNTGGSPSIVNQPPPASLGSGGGSAQKPPAAATGGITGGAAGAPTMMATAGTTAGAAGMTAAAVPGVPASLYDAATNTLKVPAMGEGVQITTKAFDLQPGEERFTCYHAEIPVDGEINIHYYESLMAKGSHHFILYKVDNDPVPVGTMDNTGCATGFQSWVYSSAQPHIDLKIPEGVAFTLNSRQRVVFDMHYINTTTGVLHAQVALNVIFAKGTFQKAASLISYNTGIFLQPNGTQTVGGDCTPGPGAKFFYMLTHTHRRGKLATITRVNSSGQMGEELIRSTDWEVPMEKSWLTDPYLTFKQGEKFHYSCEYMNDLDQVVTAGPSAATNEMCMAITYYFPASAGGSCF